MFRTLAVLLETITIKLPHTHTLVTPEKLGKILNGQGKNWMDEEKDWMGKENSNSSHSRNGI